MNTAKYAQILLFGLSAATLWYFFFWMHKNHSVEIFRQKMFDLRDRLFDDAMDGKIGFNHPAYRLLRNTMNGFLRHGHRVTLFELLLVGVLIPTPVYKAAGRVSFSEAWTAATKNAKKDEKEMLESYRQNMNDLIVTQALLSTPFFLIFYVIGMVMVRLPGSIYDSCREKLFRHITAAMKGSLDRVESSAMACGST